MSATPRIKQPRFAPPGILVLLLFSSPWDVSDERRASADSPVQRSSVDRDADLFAWYLKTGEFVAARTLCRQSLEIAGNDELVRGRWTALLAQAQLAERLRNGIVTDDELEQAFAPIANLLEAYPQHPYRHFLEAQRLQLLCDACIADCVDASMKGNDAEAVNRTVLRTARMLAAASDVLASLSRARTEGEQDIRTSRSTGLTADIRQWEQRTRIRVLQVLLAVTEIFPPDSVDYREAATKAQRFAEFAVAATAVGTVGRIETELLQIEALARSGDREAAWSALNEMKDLPTVELRLRALAMRLRFELEQQKYSSVASALDAYYQSLGNDQPSLEVDLVRLRYLIEKPRESSEPTSTDQAILQWLDTIQSRYGLYERRLAESVYLRYLRQSPGDGSMGDGSMGDGSMGDGGIDAPRVSAAVAAAQGEQWLRRGDSKRAGELLAAAAMAETDIEQAKEYAVKAAAAFTTQLDGQAKAISILFRTAVRDTTSDGATLALQAAVLSSQQNDSTSVPQLDSMLSQILDQWPDAPANKSARNWYVRWLQDRQRWLDAAIIALQIPASHLDGSSIDSILTAWHEAVRRADEGSFRAINQRVREVLSERSNVQDPALQQLFVAVGALALDLDALVDVERWATGQVPVGNPALAQPFALYQFRRMPTTSAGAGLRPSGNQMRGSELSVEAMFQRLLRDAMQDPSRRRTTANILREHATDETARLSQIVLCIWLDQITEAEQVASDLIRRSTSPGATAWEVAELMESHLPSKQLEIAVRRWDELSTGLPKTEARWQEAKLRAAKLLAKSGDLAEAKKRAQYVLLTNPPSDPSTRQEWESLLNEASP